MTRDTLRSWVHAGVYLATDHGADTLPAAGVTDRGAQTGRNPWVGALGEPLGPKGVTVRRPLCAELLRSSCRKEENDRVATG